MSSSNLSSGKLRNFLHYARNHRIPIHPETRKIGIVCTLVGWACIALIETNLSTVVKSGEDFRIFFNFLVVFLAGTFWLFVASFFMRKDFLKIKESTENKREDQTHHITHLSVIERKTLVRWRGFIAVVGYMLYSWVKSNTQVIDNSAAFSTDAIMYALIMQGLLKIKVSASQWATVGVVFLGVCFMVSFDTFGGGHIGRNILSLGLALVSAAALAIIILLNSVIVQHEPPLRIAFFQCLIGLICASIVVVGWVFVDPSVVRLINLDLVARSFASGTIYAISLLFFFNAFLYAEPFLIVMLGYSIFPFVIFSSWISGNTIHPTDLIGAALIFFGGLSSVLLQFKEDKQNTHASVAGYPIYLSTLKEKFRALRQDFLSGRLGMFEYLAQRHEFNKLIFEYAQEIKTTDIEKIEIDQREVIFTLKPFNFKMLSDKGCRSAPLEILNFGSYEKDESSLVFQVVQDGDIILDIGANLGWYSIQLSKRFNNAVIHAFEPIYQTFSVLEKNIKLNNLINVILHNVALGNIEGEADFFYFTGGSAVASRENLLDHRKARKVGCKITTLDSIVSHLDLQKIDFLKCDVEGSELDVIKGGFQSIGKFLPIIYIELFHGWCKKFGYTPDDVVILLKKLGYKCFKIYNKSLVEIDDIKENPIGYNFFFMHPQKHVKLINKISEKV